MDKIIIIIEITPERVAQIGSTALSTQMERTTAEAFLKVHGRQLEENVLNYIRAFIVGKLG